MKYVWDAPLFQVRAELETLTIAQRMIQDDG